jgi:hypothetical protein
MQQYAPNSSSSRKPESLSESVGNSSDNVNSSSTDSASNTRSDSTNHNRLATIEESLLSPSSAHCSILTQINSNDDPLSDPAAQLSKLYNRRASQPNSLTGSPESDHSITSDSSAVLRLKAEQRARSAAELSCASSTSSKSHLKNELLEQLSNAFEARFVSAPVCDQLFDFLHYLLLKHQIDLTQPPYTRSVSSAIILLLSLRFA